MNNKKPTYEELEKQVAALREELERFRAETARDSESSAGSVVERGKGEESAWKYLDIANVVIVTVDREQKITFVNRKGCEVSGYTKEELAGKNCIDLCMPGYFREEARKVFGWFLEKSVDVMEYYEAPIVTKSGEERLVAWKSTLIQDESGTVSGTLSFGEDITKRKETEDRFRLAAGTASDLVYEWNVENDTLIWFGDIDEALGYEKGEFGHDIESWVSVIHPEDRKRLENAVERHRTSTEQINEEYRVKSKSGEWLYWSDRGRPVLNREGKPTKWVGVCTDITKRKKAEQELIESEQRYRKYIDNSPMGIFITDETGSYIEANRAGIEMVGYPEEDLMNMSIPDIFDLEYAEAGLKHFMRVQGEGKAVGDLGFVRKDGTKYLMSVHGIKLSDDRYMAMTEDATQRKDNEAEIIRHREHLEELVKERTAKLKDSEERFRRLTDNLPDIIMRWIPDYGLDYVNPAMERILGISEESLMGNWGSFMSHVHPDDVNAISQAFREMGMYRKETQITEYRVIRDDGETVWLEAIWKPLWDENGKLMVVEALARDVTERKTAEKEREKLQQQLIQSQKMEAIGTLAGGIAHDFNNIIATISGTAELLLQKTPVDAPYYARIERILNSSGRAKDLTMKLLTFARKERLNITRTRVNGIVRDVIDMLEGTVSKKIGIEYVLEDNLDDITVDSTQILQALLNISINACDSMAGGGVLRIETEETVDERQRRCCVISISDTGKGIDPGLKDKIFEPFFTTKERGKGSGLGLSVSHGIIKEHNGFIKIESDREEGTTFRVFIPVSRTEDLPQQEKIKDERMKKYRGTVLVVDDDRDFVLMAKEALELQGFEIIATLSGKEAVEQYEKNKDEIDVVMLDMLLPGMDGAEIFHALKRINTGVNIILCSGFSLEGDATELLKEGAKGYIQKPFSINELSEALFRIVRNDSD